MNKDSTPITAFLPFFLEMIQLLVAETNKHYLDLLDSDGRCAQLPDMTEQEMNIFLTIIIQMGQFYRPFYSNIEVANCERLWKIRPLFDLLIDTHANFYSSSEHLDVDEVNVLFNGRVTSKQNIPKKHACFSINIYKHFLHDWLYV